MLLIFLSRAASSLLMGSLGLPRFFSLGTSPARGWRWPIGACGRPPLLLAPDPAPVWAMAVGAPIKARIAIEARGFFMLFMLLLPSLRRVQMNIAAIIGHTIAHLAGHFTLRRRRILSHQIARADRRFARPA